MRAVLVLMSVFLSLIPFSVGHPEGDLTSRVFVLSAQEVLPRGLGSSGSLYDFADKIWLGVGGYTGSVN